MSGKTVTDFPGVPSRRLAIALEQQICRARSFLFRVQFSFEGLLHRLDQRPVVFHSFHDQNGNREKIRRFFVGEIEAQIAAFVEIKIPHASPSHLGKPMEQQIGMAKACGKKAGFRALLSSALPEGVGTSAHRVKSGNEFGNYMKKKSGSQEIFEWLTKM